MNTPPDGSVTRRSFVTTAASAAALALIANPSNAAAASAITPSDVNLAPGNAPGAPKTILFQGDSITDAGRSRPSAAANAAAAVPAPVANSAAALGNGYPLLIASEQLRAHPAAGYRFFNRGISGNRIPDLITRWQDDTLALKPDVLSILIGVNDLWHKIMGRSNGTVAEYEQGYGKLLEDTKAALPNTQLVVLEPFVLRTGAVTDAWFPEFDERRAAAARVAKKVHATFIPLHSMFEKLSREAPPAYWAADGVHPTPAGHAAIAQAWMHAVHL